MARLVRLRDADRSFDLEFWRRVGAEGRFAAAWQMVKEVAVIRGGDGHQPRLQRSVAKFVRRRRPLRDRREDLIRAKRSAGRLQDLLDLDRLKAQAAKRRSPSKRKRR